MTHHEYHLPTRAEVLAATSKPIPAVVKTTLLILTVLGAVAFIAGVFVNPDRAWRAFHVNWLFFTLISTAGVVFVAVQRIATARWSRPIIRFLEGYVAFLPVAFVFLLLILFVGQGHIFPWTHEAPPVAEKVTYLDHGFLSLRVLVAFGLLTLLGVWYVWTSLRLDVGLSPESGAPWARGLRARMRDNMGPERREIHSTHTTQGRLAVLLALAYGYGCTSLAFDLSMALDMHFQSTLYGWWVFMGAWLGAIMSFTLLVMWWRKHLQAHDLILELHFHDLGKLCFAFTAFWGYLTFSQFLIIWYGNMAEETHWMRLRLISPWMELSISVVVLMFLLPFFGLLSRAAKVFLPTLAFFAVASLVGLWLHRYLEVYPSLYVSPAGVPFGIWEIGVFLLYLGTWGLCYAAFMEAFPRMRVTLMTSPYRDEVQVPYDPESMETLPAHE